MNCDTHFFPEGFVVLGAVGLVYPLKLCFSSAAQDLDELFVVSAQAAASFLYNACVHNGFRGIVERF